jgi:hypothetical protein
MSSNTFPILEQTILKAKGLTDDNLAFLNTAGVMSKKDFATIGDTDTLLEVMPGLDKDVARRVMDWAVGAAAAGVSNPAPTIESLSNSGKLMIDSSDVSYCTHCNARQPKDYTAGDLCPSCGRQAEPVQTCHWCSQSGPGKFCRGCGAEFVPLAEFDLAILLKREGLPKDEISKRLKSMSNDEKEILWGRVRRIQA